MNIELYIYNQVSCVAGHLGAYRTTTLYFGQQHADSGLEDPGGPPEELMESRRPLYHGVPVLGIPMIFDLFDNLLHLQERGAIKRLKNWLMLTLTALSRDYIGYSTETVADTTVTKMIWAIISDIIGYATYLTDLSIKILEIQLNVIVMEFCVHCNGILCSPIAHQTFRE